MFWESRSFITRGLGGGGEGGAFGAAGVAVDGAFLVAGGTVFALAGDGFQIGGVVLRGHLDVVEEELGEGGIAIEDVGALRVDVDEVKGGSGRLTSPPSRWGCEGWGTQLGLDAAQELAEHGRFERVEEKKECRRGGEIEVEGVLLEDFNGREAWRGWVCGVGADPVGDILTSDGGERGVELDADDFAEAEFAGDEQAAAFAGADVDEGVAGDGVGRDGLAPVADEGAQDGGCDAVVGGDVLVVGVTGDEVPGGDEAAGVDAVRLVEGMDGEGRKQEPIARAGGRRDETRFLRDGF
jgi:hypothetical protein